METVKALRSGTSLTALTEKYHLKARHHDTLPLVILTYDQIHSPKTAQVVRECRGLVLERDTWRVVARSFYRFFNVGEVESEASKFGSGEAFWAIDKEDGSLITLFNYKGQWMVKTKGSFAQGLVATPQGAESNISWSDLFWAILNTHGWTLERVKTELNPSYSYDFELCSMRNRVIRVYNEDKVLFLAARENTDAKEALELSEEELDAIGFERPPRRSFQTMEEAAAFVAERAKEDETWEGLVLRDVANRRWKMKSHTYVTLHHLYSGLVLTPKKVLEIIEKNEVGEVLAYFPELKPEFDKMEKKLKKAKSEILQKWEQVKDCKGQWEFADKIKDFKWKAVLFTMRNKEVDFETAWASADKLRRKLLAKEK